MNLSDNIKKIRERNRISQSELAKRLGVEPTNYPRIEKRGNNLTYDYIELFAKSLEVSVAELLDLTPTNSIDKSVDIETLTSDNKKLIEKIAELEDDKRRLKKQLDDYEIDLSDMSNALLYSFILGAVEPLIQLFYLKKKALNEGDNEEVLELSGQIYDAFKSGFNITKGIEIEGLYNGDLTKWNIDTSKFNKTLTNDYRLKSIIGEINVPIFKEEYYAFLAKYREELKKY